MKLTMCVRGRCWQLVLRLWLSDEKAPTYRATSNGATILKMHDQLMLECRHVYLPTN